MQGPAEEDDSSGHRRDAGGSPPAPPQSTPPPPRPSHPPGLPPIEDVPLATEEAKAKAAEGKGMAAPEPSPAADSRRSPPTPPVAAKESRAAVRQRRREARKARPHPYAGDVSPPAETRIDPTVMTLLWFGLAVLLVGSGYLLASRYSPFVPGAPEPSESWEALIQVPLFTGIALLGFGFSHKPWARMFTLAGWLVGAFYLGLWAQDLYWVANQDYVNYAFALIFGVMFVYLAYHEWLSRVRRTDNAAVRFLSISFFIGAGAYFLIDKIQAIRLGLIHVVSDHTKWMLDLFGQGDRAGLVFIVDEADNKSPTTFFYPDQYCVPGPDAVGQYCQENGLYVPAHDMDSPTNWWEELLYFSPDGDHTILPVSIILACTALQSIMVFVGLFSGTTASLRRKVLASVIVGSVVYILNLVRNTGIIWFYGQGHASFWMMHDAIGKGGSLAAMILIAFGVFRWFPEFLQALFGVLDLVERDGPIERALKIGRRRPPPGLAAVPAVPTVG